MVGVKFLVMLIDNHQLPSASGQEKRLLWQRGDVVKKRSIDVRFGKKTKMHPHFVIIKITDGLPPQFNHLTDGHPSGQSRRTQNLNLDSLYAQMTTEEKGDFDTLQEVTLSTNGKAQIDTHTKGRPF